VPPALSRPTSRKAVTGRRTGFRNYGTNGYDWFPLHQAIHARWWGKGGLDPDVYGAIRTELQARFEDWEAELVLLPLRQ
jgi:hypothetical protein